MELELKLKELLNKYGNSNLGEAVYQSLQDAIRQGILKSGYKLGEVELAQIFQVSRTPVQKALVRLEGDSLISYEPKCGYVVAQMDFKNCIDYNEYALLMYMSATTLAVRRKFSDYYKMVLQRQLRELGKVKDITSYLSQVDYFHFKIAESTHNDELIGAFKRMNVRGSIMGLLYSNLIPDNESEFIAEHTTLVNKLFDLICSESAIEVFAFMEREYCPHMRAFVTQWCQNITD